MWLPGFERWPISGRPGVPYDEYDDPKGMLHTTQGTSIEGAVGAYAPYPPHLIVDPLRKRKVQHIDLMSAAYALWNEDVDDSRCVQIEIVGYAEDTPRWSDDVYRWLGEEVARPLHEHFGIPYVGVWKGFKAPSDVDYILASASSPLRLTQWEIDHFSGWLAHQHSPEDDHWDAGGFKIDKMLAYARGSVSPPQARRKKGKRMNGFTFQVLDGEMAGLGVLVDLENDRTTGITAFNLAASSKEAGVPHYGVTDAEARDLLQKYGAGNPAPKSA